jgi:acetate kinase
MSTILVVNAGSFSVKFQVFALESGGELGRKLKGQMDGIGTRPRLRASGPDAKTAVDRTFDKDTVPDVPAALHTAGRMATRGAEHPSHRDRPPRRAWRSRF